jgi:hypothetical protein
MHDEVEYKQVSNTRKKGRRNVKYLGSGEVETLLSPTPMAIFTQHFRIFKILRRARGYTGEWFLAVVLTDVVADKASPPLDGHTTLEMQQETSGESVS